MACGDEREAFVDPLLDAGAPDSSTSADTGSVDAADATADAALPEERVECKTTPCVLALAARGGAHVCALLSDKTVACWGADDSGQLGLGVPDGGGEDPLRGSRPTKVADVSGATQISAVGADAAGTSCARLEDGTVTCWGSNAHGQLALGDGIAVPDGDPHPVPSRVHGLAGATRVDLGGAFGCAVAGGDLHCWGWNSALQLGRGYLPKSHGSAAKVALGARFAVAASGSSRNTFAITADGELLSWGGSAWDDQGSSPVRDALGRESSVSPDGTPTPIPNFAHVASVSAGALHACAVVGQVAHCWGRNPTGAIGNGTRQDIATPYAVTIEAGRALREIAVSNRTTCARTAVDGSIYCWGDNADGQLGGGHTESTLYPVRVSPLGGRAVQVVAMDRATCALIADGSVECWGSNARGQLGLGSRDDEPHLTPQKAAF